MPFVASVLSALIPQLAARGLDNLQSLFRRATDQGVDKVTQILKEKTGIDITDIADGKVSETQWSQLKEFDLEYQEEILRQIEIAGDQEIDRLEIAAEDRADAREMQEQAMKSDYWLTRNFVYLYAFVVTISTFVFLGWVIFSDDVYRDVIDPITLFPTGEMTQASAQKARVVDTIVGFLLGVTLSAIIQFFFGSSAGSSQKNEMLQEQLRNTTPGGQ